MIQHYKTAYINNISPIIVLGFKVENSLKSQTIMLIHRVTMCARRIKNFRYNSIKNQVIEYNEYPNEQKINIFGEDINFFLTIYHLHLKECYG